MATAKVHPARDLFQRMDSNNGDELQTGPTGRRSTFRVKSEIENEMDEESTSVTTLGRKEVTEGKEANARESVLLKRLVIALIIIVFLLSVIVLSLVIVLVKAKSEESDETGNKTQQASAEKLQGTFLDTEALIRLNNLEENMKSLQQNLEEKTKDIILPRCFLRYFDAKCKESEELALKIQNISQRLDASVSAINVSFFQELASVKTSFESKVNNSLQQFNHDDGLAFNQLRSLNTTLTNELADTKQTYVQYNDAINKKIESMNHTITEKVTLKIAEPGPIGVRGKNGSKGPTGDAGQQGLQGPTGIKGPKGAKGDKGSTGDPGFPGKNGIKEETGDKGIKGQKGDNGTAGQKGVQGDQGSRGIGNFSWCQLKDVRRTAVGQKVSVSDSQNFKVFGASCTTSTSGAESNLQVNTNTKEYECECKTTTTQHSAPNCVLYYWECPIQPP